MGAQRRLQYFAYGSNMLTCRLRERVPSASPIGVGRLKGYVLRWDKRSKLDGSGKCDAEATGRLRDSVWGVLFALKASEKHALDRAEGLGNGYVERRVAIILGEEGTRAVTYIATDKRPSLKPYHWYKALVVAGAREHRLPQHYIRRLLRTRFVRDPDSVRAEENLRMLVMAQSTKRQSTKRHQMGRNGKGSYRAA